MVTRSKKETMKGKQKESSVKVGNLGLRKETLKNLTDAEKKQIKGGRGTGGDYSCLQVWSCFTK